MGSPEATLIGALFPPSGRAAQLGRTGYQGARLAAEEINEAAGGNHPQGDLLKALIELLKAEDAPSATRVEGVLSWWTRLIQCKRRRDALGE
jgi:ABC-type branched-subunit amino acid transport system substrate-binding protein